MPLVSVLMPVYNRETLVSDAIRSIQNQTFENWELIILDDASTDQTLEVCRGFEKEDRRIRVLTNEKNLGVGQTRNRLLTFAQGKYIAIQDSDDISEPDRFACEVQLLESNPEIGIVSGVTEWMDFETGQTLWHYPVALHRGEQYPQNTRDMVKLLYVGCEVANAACMFRRSLIAGIPSPYGNYLIHEDWYFFLQMAHLTLFWGIPRILVKMNRGKNHLHVSRDPLLKESHRLVRDVYNAYKDDPQSPIDRASYRLAVSTFLTTSGIHLGGWSGFSRILRAVFWYPQNKRALRSIREFCKGKLKGTSDFSQWQQA